MTEKITQVTFKNEKDEIFAVCTEHPKALTKNTYWECTFCQEYSLHTAAEFIVTFFNSSIVNATEIKLAIKGQRTIFILKSEDNTFEHYLKEISSYIYFG